jgi:hypothetical protein
MRRALPCLACALLAACGEDWKPETVVEGLRVLGMRATPAELHPGDTARLEALVVDPSRPGKRTTVIWLGCDPDPFDLGRSACSDPSVLSNPAAFSGGGLSALPPGMHAIGFNELAAYTAPANSFDQLPAGDARRVKGTVAQVLAFVVAEEVSPAAPPEELAALLERVKAKEVKSLIALFRIRVTEEPQLNKNPALSALWVDDARLPDGATLRVEPGTVVRLEATVPDEAFEEYDLIQPEGVVHKTEAVVAAWYSSWGRFSESRVSLRTETVQRFTAPGNKDEALPDSRAGTFYVVLRDSRGGQAWTQTPGFLCDTSLPAPAVTALEPAAGPADGTAPLALAGANLDSVLDVLVGGKALAKGAYSPARDRFEGGVPRLLPGSYPVLVRGRDCHDVDTGLTYLAQ